VVKVFTLKLNLTSAQIPSSLPQKKQKPIDLINTLNLISWVIRIRNMMLQVHGLAFSAIMSIIYQAKILKESFKLIFPKEHSNKPSMVGLKLIDKVLIGHYCSD